MSISAISEDPERHALSNELHARPFPEVVAPCHAFCIAIRFPGSASGDRGRATEQLLALLDRFGAQHPPKDANHYFGPLGRHRLKWERHTEFSTYTIFVDGLPERPFAVSELPFPQDWSKSVSGHVISASMVHIEAVPKGEKPDQGTGKSTAGYFVPESLCVARVLDGAAVLATDFRVDENGLTRFLVRTSAETGARRLGRITQRLFEIETYKSMAMLALPCARDVSTSLTRIDSELSDIVAGFSEKPRAEDGSLGKLIDISAELEHLAAQNDSRFSAARAYSAIVGQRVEVLREERVSGRQTFAEFLTRRFDPAMRTCEATASRLSAMSTRANRAAQLLRTQVDVAREEQNQQILTRMDQRAADQLKLQKTVEGLSVVAVSYYAVNLAANIAIPFAEPFGLSKPVVAAILTPPVILLVWLMIRRIRKEF